MLLKHFSIAIAVVLAFFASGSSAEGLDEVYNAVLASWQQNMIVNVFNSTFYATPGNYTSTSSKPGEIFTFEKVSGSDQDKQYAYSPGLSLFRMLYVYKDLNQKPCLQAPSSCCPTTPSSPASLICAPLSGPMARLELHGTVHPASKGLTYNWAIIGHSEGGLAAWAVNEHQSVEPAGGFLGAVSSINQRQLAVPELRAEMETAGTVFLPLTFLESIRRRLNTTAVNVSDWLTPKGEKILQDILKRGCIEVASALVPGSKIDNIFKSVAGLNASLTDAWTDNVQTGGMGALARPMLVVQGDADEAVDPLTNFKTYQANCAANGGSKIRYSIYPD
ncbi:hypothetical protein M427DRAFT_39897 [Gonapodya prolifera JEL478]|uniref:Alpha/beta-hydrolase n=1 Tax=Gonapodya prolifera (strain JEL478) TaxID=1344416 RepID=A0A138ZWE3_GONPJ|nr:hypothetical protein M427DRAFT_39897 [Gonapodya prolifera JEL478]|eukprot:KXS08832.1 hypothetical protein M427DRAFT_39897 [Gonapodya prolifera JEL478]